MKSPIITKNDVKVDISDETAKFMLKIGSAFCALVGIWAISCLAAGSASAGPMQMIRGFITTITGL